MPRCGEWFGHDYKGWWFLVVSWKCICTVNMEMERKTEKSTRKVLRVD